MTTESAPGPHGLGALVRVVHDAHRAVDVKLACMSHLWGPKAADLAKPDGAERTRAWMTDIAQAGYDGFAVFDELLLGLAGTGFFAALVEETGLKLASVDYVIGRDFDRLRRVCEVMQGLGAPHLVTISGLAQRGADMDQIAELLDAMGEVALQYGVRACYHNHTHHTGETLEETEALLARTDPAKFFGFLDVGHATKDFAGHPVEQRAALFLERNWDRIDFLEFKDWSEEHDLCTEVGAGRCDYAAVFAILKRKGYAGWITVEQNGPMGDRSRIDSVRASLEFIRSGLGL